MGVCNSNKKEKNKGFDDLDDNKINELCKKQMETKYNNDNERTKLKENNKKNVNQQANDEIKNFIVEKMKNESMEDYNLIKSAIKLCVVLNTLDDKAIEQVIKKMSLCKIDDGKIIFEEGNIGNYFYIVKSGDVKILIKGSHKKTLSSGDFFGELALLYGGERTATTIANGEVFLWCLERNNFKRIIEYLSGLNYEENKKFVKSIPMLGKLLFI